VEIAGKARIFFVGESLDLSGEEGMPTLGDDGGGEELGTNVGE